MSLHMLCCALHNKAFPQSFLHGTASALLAVTQASHFQAKCLHDLCLNRNTFHSKYLHNSSRQQSFFTANHLLKQPKKSGNSYFHSKHVVTQPDLRNKALFLYVLPKHRKNIQTITKPNGRVISREKGTNQSCFQTSAPLVPPKTKLCHSNKSVGSDRKFIAILN